MKLFYRFALLSTIGSYLIIFTGGLVRVSGAGLGCPDWPTCFGRWIPPLSVSDLPAGVDPASFNIALAWVEYSNRLVGVLLGLIVAATCVLALINYRKVARVLIPMLLAGLGVAYAGWQGGQVVLEELKPLLVSIHLFVALLVMSLLTYATQQAYYLQNPSTEIGAYPRKVHRWLGILWLLAILQIALGTHVRASLETLEAQMPLLSEFELMGRVGAIKYIHMVFGIIVAIGVFQVGVLALKEQYQPTTLVRYGVWTIIIMAVLQILLGGGMLSMGTPPLIQVFHLWSAAILLGMTLLLYSEVKRLEVTS